MPRNPTSQDFFKLYTTDEIIDRIVTKTNLYAEQFIEKEHGNPVISLPGSSVEAN